MSHNVPSLGAINIETGKYEYPLIAQKNIKYKCPECNKLLLLRKGKIRKPHFAHYKDDNPCNYYNNPGETQIHKDAKMLLKTLFENKNQITIERECNECKEKHEFDFEEMTETSSIKLEYRFDYNGTKIADVAYIDDSEIVCLFEICNTHKTNEQSRPEPWFEINAETLIETVNNNTNNNVIRIKCDRDVKCDKCSEKEKLKIAEHEKRKKQLFIKKQMAQNKLQELFISTCEHNEYYKIEPFVWRGRPPIIDYQYCIINNNIEHPDENINTLHGGNGCIWDELYDENIKNTWINKYTPSYEQCIFDLKTQFIDTIDILLIHKGTPEYVIMLIYNANEINFDRVEKLLNTYYYKCGLSTKSIYFIYIDWILSQNKTPTFIPHFKYTIKLGGGIHETYIKEQLISSQQKTEQIQSQSMSSWLSSKSLPTLEQLPTFRQSYITIYINDTPPFKNDLEKKYNPQLDNFYKKWYIKTHPSHKKEISSHFEICNFNSFNFEKHKI
jgi:uncharacterized protein YkuJ